MKRVADSAYVVDESVTSMFPIKTRWDSDPEQYVTNKGGGLGYGLPVSIGGAIAERQRDNPREVIGFVGDGSYLYYPNAIYSAARYDLDLTVVIADNRNYRILKDDTLDLLGGDEEDHEFVGMDFDPQVDIVQNAESHVGRAELVENPDGIERALEDALARDGVDVLDVLVHD
ncbi:acetolactate synthase [Natrinema versiforme JCM 10478]|uniref:Acetolactate synthase n=1 Tax=Natrinema versiforme JCM 10478 TaxID=1227496 RepID=L9XML0_9EURY|nr:acetolactate synthase [Natrinema versiforme JCM 10478]